jgi:hypothetical protein
MRNIPTIITQNPTVTTARAPAAIATMFTTAPTAINAMPTARIRVNHRNTRPPIARGVSARCNGVTANTQAQLAQAFAYTGMSDDDVRRRNNLRSVDAVADLYEVEFLTRLEGSFGA